jgi:hypothetical protein
LAQVVDDALDDLHSPDCYQDRSTFIENARRAVIVPVVQFWMKRLMT